MSSGSGSGGGGGSQYVPGGLPAADNTFQNGMYGSADLASGARTSGIGGYQQSFDQMNDLDYSGYTGMADRAGQAYGQMGDTAMGQVGQYGQQAATAMGQQGQMYDASGRVLSTAFDPQSALYSRTAQQTQDQVRAGQAARGLGNSEAGAMEEAGAMGNFNIDWQNAQLARQATGIQAAGSAQHAGMGQGRMAGADMSAELAAGAAGAGYYGQAGQVPFTAHQYAAGGAGRASDELTSGYGVLQQMYGNSQDGTIPYMNAGNGAIQKNYSNQYQVNRDAVSAMSQFGQSVGPSVKSWFGNGSNGYSGGSFDSASYNDPSSYNTSGSVGGW